MRSLALSLLLLIAGLVPGGLAAADKVEAISSDLAKIEGEVGTLDTSAADLERKYKAAPAETFQHSVQRRLMDAMLLYEFKSYDKAVVLFAELVRIPEFKSNRDYWQVVFYLAESLYKLGNRNSAATYFGSIVDGNVPALAQPALGYLLDIAMSTRNFALLNRYYRVLDAIPAAQRSSALVYEYGKALYFQGGLDDAAVEFSRLQPGDPYRARAQYYVGVIRSRKGDFANALSAFRGALEAAKGSDADEDRAVRDMANLGLGRLLEETGQFLDAVNAYQEIPRYSPQYETSLYEMTWAYIKMNKFDRALRTLDTLILVVEDDALRIQANILRGRLSIFLKRFDEADDAYHNVVEQFTPLKNELLAFMASRENVANFFKWLMAAQNESQPRPLSDRALQWMQTDEKMTQMLAVFTDIREQKREVDEFERLIVRLRARLNSDSAIEIYPNLSDAWYAVAEVENRLIRSNGAVLNAERSLVSSSLAADDKARLAPIWKQREDLEKRFFAVPLSASDYAARRSAVTRAFDRLDADLTLVEQSLQEELRDADIMYQWAVRDATGTDGKPKSIGDLEKQRLTAIGAERGRLGELSQAVRDARENLEVQRVVAGAGDEVMKGEAELKKQLLAVQATEAAIYAGRKASLAGAAVEAQGRAEELHRRIGRKIERLGGVQAVLLQRTREKVAETRREVDTEETEVRAFKDRLSKTESQTLGVTEQVGSALFSLARDQIRETVLEADLGLIDIAWQKKQDVTGEIQNLNEARSAQLKQIDENLKGSLEK